MRAACNGTLWDLGVLGPPGSTAHRPHALQGLAEGLAGDQSLLAVGPSANRSG